MDTRVFSWAMGLAMIFAVMSCETGSFSKIKEQELARGVRNDSLFHGIKFGMTSKEFYTVCWELNKKGVLGDGPSNMTAEYIIDDFDHPIKMNFYPTFKDGKINSMPVDFAYKAWAPWNRELFSDSLQPKVLTVLEKWYGKGFNRIDDPEEGELFYSIDGNRVIFVYRDGDKLVKVLFKDLLAEEEKSEEDEL